MRRSGILGINRRNVTYTLGHNRRALYPLVDDKLSTKRLCQAAGIPVPKLLAVVRTHHETQRLGETVRNFPAFVVKPARGAMGNGILVLEQREGGLFRGSRAFDLADLIYHSAGIVSGLYSLAGSADVAVIEERLKTDPGFDRLVANGVPDVRIIVFEGVPVMAMCRLPTIESNGRANLHQGGVGAGLDLMTGTLTTSIQRDRPVKRSPDTLAVIEGFRIPHFEQALNTAVKATDQTRSRLRRRGRRHRRQHGPRDPRIERASRPRHPAGQP